MKPDSSTKTLLIPLIEAIQQIARFDHSVSVPTLGSVFNEGVSDLFGEMRESLASIYNVPFVFPSTNGTTSLNVLALMSLTKPGDTILCQRDCHISMIAPMIHTGLRPVFVEPTFEDQLGLNIGVSARTLHHSVKENPDVKAIVLTYPNYFGIANDIHACAQIASQFNIPMLVDAAHGAHFGFHSDLPLPAQETTATIITQSIHKTCSALSQGSLALLNDESYLARFYEAANQLGFISTSFSYPILASIAVGVWQLYEQGQYLLDATILTAQTVRNAINEIEGLVCFGADYRGSEFMSFDPLRITVDVSQLGLTGYEIEAKLINQYHIYPELATLNKLLFILTLADDPVRGTKLVEALHSIASEADGQNSPLRLTPPPIPMQILPPRPVFFHPYKEQVPILQSTGRISAETIACYPPGSPIIVAGEEITESVISFLSEVHHRGGTLKGASDPTFQTIKVISHDWQ